MKVVVTAGGTGGHIYPALSIIKKIKELEPSSEFLYIGTHNRMEKDIVPKFGIPYYEIEMYGISKKISKNIKMIFSFLKASRCVKKKLIEFKPDVVIGVGGYVTVPVIRSAKKLGIKTFIHEQNSIPGKANLFLQKYADVVGVSFSESSVFFKSKTVFTGNPRSEDAFNNEPYKREDFGLSDKKLVVFVMGSLGATRVNDVIIRTLPKFEKDDVELIFITGNKDFESINEKKFPSNVKVLPYVEDLTKLMKITDLMVSRTGASTLSEISSLSVPSILIPSPYVPNNHQYKNALPFYEGNAALMIEESDLNEDLLYAKILDLLYDESKISEFKKNLPKFSLNNSATKIYDVISKMVKEK